MITVGVGELKPNFSDILHDVRGGEEVVISYGRRKEKVAVIVPYKKYCKRNFKDMHHNEIHSLKHDENHQLDAFIGTWVEDPEFDNVIKTFDSIDEELWK